MGDFDVNPFKSDADNDIIAFLNSMSSHFLINTYFNPPDSNPRSKDIYSVDSKLHIDKY